MDAIFQKLWRACGGPVRHETLIDGWRLVMTQADDGEVWFGGQQGEQVFGFRRRDIGKWVPILRNTKESDLEFLVELAERAEWKGLPQ